MKRCSACEQIKPLDQFNCKRGAKDRRQDRCRDCQRYHNRRWYANNAVYVAMMHRSPHVRNRVDRCSGDELCP